jgi:predicted Zn finger-like uncharacterized protein
MPTTVDCPSCNRKLRIPDELLGKKVKCPTCGNAFTASAAPSADPMEEEAPPPSPRRAAAPPPPEEEYQDEPAEEQGEERPSRRRRSRKEPHRGTLILILGILGLVTLPPLGTAAWLMGNHDLKEIDAGRMDSEGRGATNAGRICGMIATILMIVYLVCGCAVGMMIIIAAASNAH